MPAAPQSEQKKPRHWRRRLLILTLALGCFLFGLFLLRNVLFGGWLKNSIADALAAATQCDVSIDELSGSWFGGLRLDGIEMLARKPEHNSLQRLQIDRAEASWNGWGLLTGFDIEDLHALQIDNLHLKLKSIPGDDEHPVELDQLHMNPSAIAAITQAQLPDLRISGRISWQQDKAFSSSDFRLHGNDDSLNLKLENSVVNNKAQDLGPITIERHDRQTFHLKAPQLHQQIQLERARCVITPHAIDAKLPLRIAGQQQTVIWHYSRHHQSLDLNLDFYWAQTPPLIRSLAPQLLPHHGHSRLVANIHHAEGVFDMTCMLQASNLQWTVNDKLIEASVHAFIKNDDHSCTIEVNNIDIKAPAHHASITNTFLITSQDHRRWQVEETTVKTRSGSLDIGGVLAPANSDFSMRWQQFDIGLLAGAFELNDIDGHCDGSLIVTGDIFQPDINLEIKSPSLRYADQKMQIDLICSQNERGINIDHCSLTAENYVDALIIGSWPMLIGAGGWRSVNGGRPDLSVQIEAHRLERWPKLHQHFTSGNAFLSLDISQPADELIVQGQLDMSDIHFDIIEDHDDFTLNGSHLFHLSDSKWLWQFQLAQRYEQYIKGRLRMDAPGALLQIGEWQADWLKLCDSIQGRIDAHDIHFKLKGAVPRIGNVRGGIDIDGRRISTSSLRASLGYEPIRIDGSVTCGWPHLERCDLTVVGERILLVQSPGLRLRTDCDLRLSKSSRQPLNLTGTMQITDALYTAEFITTNRHTPTVDTQFQLFSLPESFLGGAALDVRLSADNSIRIRNSMLRADASGEMRIRGTGMVPEPSGEVLIHDNSVLKLPFSYIWFSPSTITFNPAEPFNPRFIINGRAKMQGYDLRIILEGKMSEFSVNGIDVVSNPPLSREEATRLITTGIPPRNINSTGKDIDTSGLVIGWAIVESLRKVFGGDDPEHDDFINRIEVQIGREVSENGYNTIEVTVPIPYTEHYYLKAERDKYEDFNAMIKRGFEW